MADKKSNLTFTAPPDGGDTITSYRALVYEGTDLVATVTAATPPLVLTHSATAHRTAVVQAGNGQGWSNPVELTLYAATPEEPPVDPGDGDEDGTVADDITAPDGRALSYDPGEFYWVRNDFGNGPYDHVDLRWAPAINGVDKFEDYSLINAEMITGAANGTTYDVWLRARNSTNNTYADSRHTSVTIQSVSHTTTPPTLTGSRDGSLITIAFANPGSGGTFALYRDGQILSASTAMPYSETDDAAHYYTGTYSNGGLTWYTNAVPIDANPDAGGGNGGDDGSGNVVFRDDFTTDGPLASSWELIGGTLATQSGGAPVASRQVTNAYNGIILQKPTWTANASAYIIAAENSDYGGGAVFRWVDSKHFFFMNSNSLYRVNGGNGLGSSEEQLGYIPSLQTGDKVQVVDENGQIRLAVNDVVVTWHNVITDVDELAIIDDPLFTSNTGRVGLLLPVGDPGPSYIEITVVPAAGGGGGEIG